MNYLSVLIRHWLHQRDTRNNSETTSSEVQSVTRDLTIAYLGALSLIAGLSICTHLLLDRALKQNISSAVIVNVAGRQRMLSQRISLYAQVFMSGDRSSKLELQRLTALMEQSHLALIGTSNKVLTAHKLSPESQQLYFAKPTALDRRTREFIQQAKTLTGSSSLSQRQAAYSQIRRGAMNELLPLLDQAVSQLEKESRDRLGLLRQAQQMVLGILLLTLSLEAIFIFRPLVSKAQHANQQLLILAMRDELTKLFNRRAFIELSEREIMLAQRNGQALTLLIVDIDHFKRINDTYGHATGDEVIRCFARLSLQLLRKTDIVGRIGGEEFAIILPASTIESSRMVAERLRLEMAAVRLDSFADLNWTISIGLATLTPEDNQLSTLMSLADQALYKAKAQGRNQVVCVKSGVIE